MIYAMINLYILILKLIINVSSDAKEHYPISLLSVQSPSNLHIRSVSGPYHVRILSNHIDYGVTTVKVRCGCGADAMRDVLRYLQRKVNVVLC